MPHTFRLRTFVPSKNFEEELQFYRELGFQISHVSDSLAVLKVGLQSFYLQKYYVKDWADNFMLFLEVSDVDEWYAEMQNLKLAEKYKGVKFEAPKDEEWGRVCRLITPTGVLWHFGRFKT